jgi:hypothetical protein
MLQSDSKIDFVKKSKITSFNNQSRGKFWLQHSTYHESINQKEVISTSFFV